MKKIIVQLIITVLLLGCGGGSGNTSTPEISQEKTILNQEVLYIVNNKQKENCESHEYYNFIAEYNPDVKNVLIKSIDENGKTCADYSKDKTNCEEFNMEEESKFCCLIGSDKIISTEDATQWYDKWYNKDWYFNQWKTEEEIAQLENTASTEETAQAVYIPSAYERLLAHQQELYNQQLQEETQDIIINDILYGGYDDYEPYSYEDYDDYGNYGYDDY
jgi:hypothetical protein